jgi:prefoldin subunit 5
MSEIQTDDTINSYNARIDEIDKSIAELEEMLK